MRIGMLLSIHFSQKKVNPMRQMCLPHIQTYDKSKIAGKITDSFSYYFSLVVFKIDHLPYFLQLIFIGCIIRNINHKTKQRPHRTIFIPGTLIIFFLTVSFLLPYPSYPLKWIIKIRVNTKLDFPNGYPIRRKTNNQGYFALFVFCDNYCSFSIPI